jgi:3-hydroxyisobutyrate dehydrogenase
MKIGIIGTGLMGRPIAERFVVNGHEVHAWNRTVEKTQPLAELGVHIADSPGGLISKVECVITMVTNAQAIHDTILSEDACGHLANRAVIQMSTILPGESMVIKEKVDSAGGKYIEAPVLGSIPQVISGTLIVMVGATPEQFARYSPVLKCLCPEPILVGEVGKAAALKLALNQLIAAETAAFSLSLGMILREGVDVALFMNILKDSALYCPTFDKKLTRMLDRNFDNPNFPTKHLLKDVNLIIEELQQLGLNASSLEGVRDAVKKAIEQGFTDTDYSSLYNAINPPE